MSSLRGRTRVLDAMWLAKCVRLTALVVLNVGTQARDGAENLFLLGAAMSNSAVSVLIVQDLMSARPGVDFISFPDWNGLFSLCKDEQSGLHHGLAGAIVMCHVFDHPVQGVGINRLLKRLEELEAAVGSLSSRVRSGVVEVGGAAVELRQTPRRECVPCGPPVLRDDPPHVPLNGIQPSVATPVDLSMITGGHSFPWRNM